MQNKVCPVLAEQGGEIEIVRDDGKEAAPKGSVTIATSL